ncbi:RDD family protein [Mesomycoplasma ovipneumoniae]
MKIDFVKAGFWRRLFAGLIDFVFLFLTFLVFFYLFLVLTQWSKIKFYLWILNVFLFVIFYRIFLIIFLKQTIGLFLTKTKVVFFDENLNFLKKFRILLKREAFLSLNWIFSLLFSSIILDLSFGIDPNFFQTFKNSSQNLTFFQQVSLSFPALFSKINFFFLIVNNLSILGSKKLTIIDSYSKTTICLKQTLKKPDYLGSIHANFSPIHWEVN